jgi:hypothetical protein
MRYLVYIRYLWAKLESENAISDDLETSKFQNFPARALCNSRRILHPSKIYWNVRPWPQNMLKSFQQKPKETQSSSEKW